MMANLNGFTGREVDVQSEVWTEKATDRMQTNGISISRMKSRDGQLPTSVQTVGRQHIEADRQMSMCVLEELDKDAAVAAGSCRSGVGIGDGPMNGWSVGGCPDWPRYALKINLQASKTAC